jgi:hypothetical protein
MLIRRALKGKLKVSYLHTPYKRFSFLFEFHSRLIAIRIFLLCVIEIFYMNYIHQIVEHILKAQEIATLYGYENLLQPGMVKELIIGDILKHEVHRTKHEPDAWDPNNPETKYEYLSCKEGGTFQLDRMFKAPSEKRLRSLTRISRNSEVFCAVFDSAHPLTVNVIYKLSVQVILAETERQLDRSSNDISHVGFTIKWCENNGEVVYRKPLLQV